ncbi:pentatricopeptide repeat-containing protein [Trifolium pratense]|uniref:Pentatricopeptide repeat-containing protein n=1 Tax=Trifolium pratense TaxID=57577 RepID=A0A2K3LU52_TRIPR|nr:pentatricopeptide repeat-containing protein [Trifolium pratense]
MNFYEYLPHEYSYALYLAYEYDLHPYDSMIINMVSERYPRDEDEDCASAYDSESCEEDESVDVAILSTSTQDLEFSTSQDSILFCSFASPIISVSIPSIASDFYGFFIKIGAITCFLGDSCCNDVDFAITASEEHKQSKNFATEFVLSAVSQKLKNQSGVQSFSSLIKFERQHDGNVHSRKIKIRTTRKWNYISDLQFRCYAHISVKAHFDVFYCVFLSSIPAEIAAGLSYQFSACLLEVVMKIVVVKIGIFCSVYEGRFTKLDEYVPKLLKDTSDQVLTSLYCILVQMEIP